MSTLVNWNGQQYLVPAYNDTGYAQGNGNLSQYLVAISTGSLQQVGGLFQLTADADFGPNFGLVSSYYKSRSANIASAGVLRLANTDAIKWRNSDNSADVTLAMNATGTAARTYTIPDLATSYFVMTEGDQTINGSKTFGSAIIGSLTGAASLNLLLTGGTMTGNIAMSGTQKLTGLAAGSGNGDSLRYEQLVGVYLPLAGGTLTGALLNAAGAVGTPSISFSSDPDTGLYSSGANSIGFATTGVLRMELTGGTLRAGSANGLAIQNGAGDVSSPAYSFQSDTDVGLFSLAANTLGIAASAGISLGGAALRTSMGGADKPNIQIEGLNFNESAMMLTRDSNDASPPTLIFAKSKGTSLGSYTAVTDGSVLGTIYFAGCDGTGLISGARIISAVDGTPGTNDMPTKLDFLTTPDGSATPATNLRITPAGATQFRDGSVSVPSMSFISDTDTGLYLGSSGGAYLGFTVGGALQFYAQGGLVMNTGNTPKNEDGSAASPSYTFWGDTNTGIFRVGTDQIGFATNGVQRAKFDENGLFVFSYPALGPNGSASAPAYSFISNLDTGIYLNGSDLNFSIDNSLAFSIQSSYMYWYRNILPSGAGSYSIGNAANYLNDVSYKTLTDRGCLPWCDDGVELADGTIVSDTEAIKSIKKHPTKLTVHGLPMLDYKSFPKKAYKPADVEGVLIARDENDAPIVGADGIEMTMMFGVFIGAIRELTERLEKLEKK